MLCERMGIDIWEVVDAAKTKPFGFMPFYPGPGLGGHCIPIDPFYLSWKAREYDFHTEFIELAGKINENMPYYVVTAAHGGAQRRSASRSPGRSVLVLGVAYKADIDDMRESPAIKIAELLAREGRRGRLPRSRSCRRSTVGGAARPVESSSPPRSSLAGSTRCSSSPITATSTTRSSSPTRR